MSFEKTRKGLTDDLEQIKANGLWKTERFINSDQKSVIRLDIPEIAVGLCIFI